MHVPVHVYHAKLKSLNTKAEETTRIIRNAGLPNQ